jgi:hypothetical protein
MQLRRRNLVRKKTLRKKSAVERTMLISKNTLKKENIVEKCS